MAVEKLASPAAGRSTRANILRALGWLAILAALVFLAQRIWVSRLWTLEDVSLGRALLVVFCGAVVYGLNCLLLSTAWCAWLRWAGESQATLSQCHGIYGRTQIAKYLPGNVFHFAGRHVVGRNVGFGHTPMVAAAVMEILALVSAAAVLAAGGLGWFGLQQATSQLHPALAVIGFGVLIALPLVVAMAARHLPGPLRVQAISESTGAGRLSWLLLPYVCTLVFMVIAGGLLVAVTRFGLVTDDLAPAPLVVGVFAFAWLAGFLVPGASGGLGVREAAIVLPLTPYLGESQAIVAALLMRMITLGGDLLYFAAAHLFPVLPADANVEPDRGGVR